MPNRRTLTVIAAAAALAVVALSAGHTQAGVNVGPSGHTVAPQNTGQNTGRILVRRERELRANKARVRTVNLRTREQSLRRAAEFYRAATWRWQDLTLSRRTGTNRDERQLQSVGYLRWVATLWKKRAARARLHARRLMADHSYLPPSGARKLGHLLAVKLYGWGGRQWVCLDTIWGTREGVMESGWKVTADNPISRAYGIPQANPGNKMSRFGTDWAKSAWVQIKWGLSYIKGKYHTPCDALAVRRAIGSY